MSTLHTRTTISISVALGCRAARLVGSMLALSCHTGTPGTGDSGPGTDAKSTGDTGSSTGASTTSGSPTTTGAIGSIGSTDGAPMSTGAPPEPACVAEGAVTALRGWPNPGNQGVFAVEVDADGGVVVLYKVFLACQDGATISFGEDAAVHKGATALAAAYDADLQVEWTHLFGASDPANTIDIHIDDGGNTHISGIFRTWFEVPFILGNEGTPLIHWDAMNSSYHGFALSFDHSRITEREIMLGSSGDIYSAAILGISGGRLAVGGYYFGVPDFAGCADAGSFGNAFLAVYAQDPKMPSWTSCTWLPGDGRAAIRDLARTPEGALVAVGEFDGEVKFGDTSTVYSQGSGDAFVAVWGEDGTFRGVTAFGSEAAAEEALAVSVGPEGRVFVVGGDGGAATGTGAFVRAFVVGAGDPALIWEQHLDAQDSANRSAFSDVAVDACGDVVVAGFGVGVARWVGDPAIVLDGAPKGGEDGLIAKLRSDGSPRWGRRIGSSGPDDGINALAIAPDRTIYVGGQHSGEIQELGLPASQGGACGDDYDAFLVRLSP